MITQIEIDGFKTFKEFKVELAPFQVIVGHNGSGKSNLFDALHLLSRLADTDLLSAFQELRGDAGELFTKLPGGGTSKRIRMAVEMLVDRKARDELGKEAELKYTRLRYELEIALGTDISGWETLHVTHESLEAISENEDNWCKKYGLSSQDSWLPEPTGDNVTFISTLLPTVHTRVAETSAPYDPDSNMPSTTPMADLVTINLHQDGQRKGKTFIADKVKRTVLSSVIDTDFPHVFAVREAMRSWKLLHLNPEVLHRPSSTKASPFLTPNGGNLPTTLARIQAEDAFAFHCVWLDMANLVPGILDIKIDEDQARSQYIIWARTDDQRSFSSHVLSDGTLRLLALATLRNDPQFHGVLCLGEPENGVHPFSLGNMTRLLREMATDFSDPEQVNEPLRQVLVTTYSPAFISQPDVVNTLLFVYTVTRVEPLSSGEPSLEITRMTPVITPDTPLPIGAEIERDKAVEAYTIDQVRKYLDSNFLEEAKNQLKKARTMLSER